MELIKKSITIFAPKEKIWNVLLNDESYRLWTSVFCEGSYYKTDEWKIGNKITFLSSNEKGLVSKIIYFAPHNKVGFEHIGFYKDGEEDFDSPEIVEWAGAKEVYELINVDNTVVLKIMQDVSKKELEMFDSMWDKALLKIKELSENT